MRKSIIPQETEDAGGEWLDLGTLIPARARTHYRHGNGCTWHAKYVLDAAHARSAPREFESRLTRGGKRSIPKSAFWS